MRVLFDYQKFSSQRAGGITRYFAELFSHFSPEVEPVVSLKFNRNMYISGADGLFLRNVTDYDFRFRGRKVALAAVERINRAYSEYDIRHQDYDILHPTYYGCYLFDMKPGRPVVTTIHDMIQELYPGDFDRKIIRDKKRHIFESDHIVAVSENTKKDILALYPGIDPSKVSVIYHGTSFRNLEPEGGPWPARYLLLVGRRDGYKNFLPFVRDLLPLMEKEKDLKIVCAGEPLSSHEGRELAGMGLYDRVSTVRATDAQLLSLYMNAEAFVFPSLYEGFGLPVLEAFRAGCPVCLSDASCFPEVAGDAALYFTPGDSESVCDAVFKCLDNKYLCAKLVERGRKRLEMFDWKSSAETKKKVYRSLL